LIPSCLVLPPFLFFLLFPLIKSLGRWIHTLVVGWLNHYVHLWNLHFLLNPIFGRVESNFLLVNPSFLLLLNQHFSCFKHRDVLSGPLSADWKPRSPGDTWCPTMEILTNAT
jgi:hypothetical protein